ncbi:hypothetical protein PRNP1_014318 [Phytophthora ramorum]
MVTLRDNGSSFQAIANLGTDDLPRHNSVSEAGASDVVSSASVSTDAPHDEVNQGIDRPRSRSSPLIATSTHIDDRDNSSAEADEEDDESMAGTVTGQVSARH